MADNDTQLRLEPLPSEEEDAEIDRATYKINTFGADYTSEILSDKLDEKEIIRPSFQRKYVWDHKRASKLIESMLLGLPIPQIFLYRESDTQNLLVVDGQQRLISINSFLKGKFDNGKKFTLLNVHSQWEGKTCDMLTEADKRRVKNYVLRATIFEQTDPKDDTSIYEIFQRLNTGGISLNQQEIRNCVIRGGINDFMLELNNHPAWRKLLKKPGSDTRMKDVEMILRFIALLKGVTSYKSSMKDFLNTFMMLNKNLEKKEQTELADLFKRITNEVNHKVGNTAFILTNGINIAVFDSIMVGLALVGIENVSNLKAKISKLKNDIKYRAYVTKSTTNVDAVQGRIDIAKRYFTS